MFSNLQCAGIFEWIEEERNTIGNHIVCKEKLNEQGVLAKRKVYVITQGFSQVPREDFTETFVSVLRFTTL